MILKAQIFKLNRDTEDQFESEFYINITRPDQCSPSRRLHQMGRAQRTIRYAICEGG